MGRALEHCPPRRRAFAVFQCSVPCGVGQRTRDVKCVSNIGDVVDDEECNMKLRPNDLENCDMGPCAKSWFLTEWSERVSEGDGGQAGPSLLGRWAGNHTETNLYFEIPRVISDFWGEA